MDAAKLDEHFAAESFDRILLDAPCSGLGVIRRKPDLKWAKQEAEIDAISELQHAILSKVHRLLKPGGVLVYSTCTIEHTENAGMVERFLAEHSEFELVRCRRMYSQVLILQLPQPVWCKSCRSSSIRTVSSSHGCVNVHSL